MSGGIKIGHRLFKFIWPALAGLFLAVGVQGDDQPSPRYLAAVHFPPSTFEFVSRQFSDTTIPFRPKGVAIPGCGDMRLDDVRAYLTFHSIEIDPPHMEGGMVAHFSIREFNVAGRMQAKFDVEPTISNLKCRVASGIFSDPKGITVRDTKFSLGADVENGTLLLSRPEIVDEVVLGEVELPATWENELTEAEKKMKDFGLGKVVSSFLELILVEQLKKQVVGKIDIKRLFPIRVPVVNGYELVIEQSELYADGYKGIVNEDRSVTFVFESHIEAPADSVQHRGDCPKPDRPYFGAPEAKLPQDQPAFDFSGGSGMVQLGISESLLNSIVSLLYEDRYLCHTSRAHLNDVLYMVVPTLSPTARLGVTTYALAPPRISFDGRGHQIGLNVDSSLGVEFFLELEHRQVPMSTVEVARFNMASHITHDDENLTFALAEFDDDGTNEVEFQIANIQPLSLDGIDLDLDIVNRIANDQAIPAMLGKEFKFVGTSLLYDGLLRVDFHETNLEGDFVNLSGSITGIRNLIIHRLEKRELAAPVGDLS